MSGPYPFPNLLLLHHHQVSHFSLSPCLSSPIFVAVRERVSKWKILLLFSWEGEDLLLAPKRKQRILLKFHCISSKNSSYKKEGGRVRAFAALFSFFGSVFGLSMMSLLSEFESRQSHFFIFALLEKGEGGEEVVVRSKRLVGWMHMLEKRNRKGLPLPF